MGSGQPTEFLAGKNKRMPMGQPTRARANLNMPESTAAMAHFPALRWYPQQSDWILEPDHSDSAAYNYPLAFRILGSLDVPALQHALDELVVRHEVFRSVFAFDQTGQVHATLKRGLPNLRELDLTGLPAETRDGNAHEIVRNEACQPFDLRVDPLLRATLITVGLVSYVLLLTTHHILCDEWSAGIVVRELFALYSALVMGRSSPLPPLTTSYGCIARALETRLRNRNYDEQFEFWRRRIGDDREFYYLRSGVTGTNAPMRPAAFEKTRLSPDLAQGIAQLGASEHVSVFMILAGAFQCVLARLSGRQEITIATCVANRNSTEQETLVGPFSNRILLQTDFSGSPTFREVLKRVRNVALDAYSNQELPFGEILERVLPTGRAGSRSIFQTLLVMQEPKPANPEAPGLAITEFPFDSPTTRYELNVWLREDGTNGLEVNLQYDSTLFDAAFMRRLGEQYVDVLRAMVANPEAAIHPVGGAIELAPEGKSKPGRVQSRFAKPQDETETQLRDVWSQILEIDPEQIDTRSDYFELGGDSLKAGRLVSQIASIFGTELPVSILLEENTIEKLAKVVRKNESPRSSNCLVSVQPSGSKLPLFCVHTHSGNVLFCRRFPKYLGPEQPVYGLQSRSGALAHPHFSVDDMARHYLSEIRSVQARGPYSLFGYSFGGLVAFEMARQLAMHGEEVAFLGMFNTPVPGSLSGWPLRQPAYLQKRIRDELEKARALTTGNPTSHSLRNCVKFARMIARSLKTDAWRFSLRFLGPATAQWLAAKAFDVESMNISAAKDFVPTSSWGGRITFFVSRAIPYAYSISPESGWGALASGGVELVEIPSDPCLKTEDNFAKAVSVQFERTTAAQRRPC
jgi:thioesterase domain-containing protein/acyl carrier protein